MCMYILLWINLNSLILLGNKSWPRFESVPLSLNELNPRLVCSSVCWNFYDSPNVFTHIYFYTSDTMSRVQDKQTKILPNGPINVQSPSLTQFSEPRRRKRKTREHFTAAKLQKKKNKMGPKGSWACIACPVTVLSHN